jgi:hypothetical protein
MPSEERSYFADFEFAGYWWLPETPNRRIHGTLRYSQARGINIDLSAPLKERDWEPGPVPPDALTNQFEIVLGQSDNGEFCTALRTIELSASLLQVGGARLRADRLYMGSNFTTEEEIQFSKQEIEFTYLEDWIGINPFRLNSSEGRSLIEFPESPQEILNVQIPDEETNLSIYLAPNVNYRAQGEFTGTRRSWVCISPKEARSYTWYEDMAARIGFFITLCVGQPIYPRRVRGELSVSTDSPLKAPRVEIYFPVFEGKEAGRVSYGSMPVPFWMIRDRADLIVVSWFSCHKEIEAVIGLLLGTYYNSHMFVETVFLTLIQAVEIFHRRVVGGSYLSDEEWQPHYEAMISAIPEAIKSGSGHRTALTNRLKWGHEFSLRKRIDELLQSLGAGARNHVTNGFDGFAGECADLRNTLVHKGGGKRLGKSFAELWTTNRRLRALLNILIWKRLGLEDRFTSDWYKRVE